MSLCVYVCVWEYLCVYSRYLYAWVCPCRLPRVVCICLYECVYISMWCLCWWKWKTILWYDLWGELCCQRQVTSSDGAGIKGTFTDFRVFLSVGKGIGTFIIWYKGLKPFILFFLFFIWDVITIHSVGSCFSPFLLTVTGISQKVETIKVNNIYCKLSYLHFLCY